MYRALNAMGLERMGIHVTVTKNPNWKVDMFDYLSKQGATNVVMTIDLFNKLYENGGEPVKITTIQDFYDWIPTHSFIDKLFQVAFPDVEYLGAEYNGLRAWLLEREGILTLNRSHYPK